jgi:UPF0755 protein
MRDLIPVRNLATLLNGRLKWLLAGAAVLLGACLLRLTLFALVPPGDGKVVREVDFPRGSSLRRFADQLEKGGVLDSARLFTLYARLNGASAKVQAGTYQFNDAMKPSQILHMLVSGEVYEKRFAVPEGYSTFQIAEMLDARGLFSKDDFLAACKDPALLRQADIKGKSVEGYLYPSTYNLAKVADAASLVRMMTQQFRSVYDESFPPLEGATGLSRGEIVTLASLVEKEAVTPEEKPLIASVFFNRLRTGMPLQSDPTALYGVRAFAGKVSGTDVRRKTPYNTYLIRGLPPGPIGNPGKGAIEAVLKPAKTNYYYFVARQDGTHQFSATLDEHNRAVRLYLKGAPAEGASPEYRNERQNITGRR